MDHSKSNKRNKIIIIASRRFTVTQPHTGTSGSNVVQIEVKQNSCIMYGTPGYQPKGDGDCEYLAQYNQSYSGLVGLVSLGCLPT